MKSTLTVPREHAEGKNLPEKAPVWNQGLDGVLRDK